MRRSSRGISSALALLCILFVITAIDGAFSPQLSRRQEAFDALLVTALFTSIIFRYSWGLWMGFVGGIIIDTLRMSPGRESVGILLALIVTQILFQKFFTNRSLWSLLLLGGVATIITRVVSGLVRISFSELFPSIVTQLLLHSIAFVALFSLFWMLGTRLRPYILVRQRTMLL